jgi:A/G-specific adenine glycosylase
VGRASARRFSHRVIAWQKQHGRHDLPWQRTRDPYRIWLSEIMLQQTQVATALPYFVRFVDAFPDVTALARAPIDDVLALWSGLGYYRRAHHLHAAAREVVARGGFPRDAAGLATLPGIGRSTAAAIAAFAYGERNAILDGNVKRVLARHRAVGGEAALWREAEASLPASAIEAYTQGMMDLGAAVCLRTRPRCDACPVHEDCVARRTQRIAQFPAPRRAKVLPQRAVRVLIIEHAGEVLLEKRPAPGIWGGLWSLPECALDDDARAVVRMRFGAEVDVREALAPIAHGFTHFALTLHPQRVSAARWPLRAEAPGIVWLTPRDALRALQP